MPDHAPEPIHQDRIWSDERWTARVIKNEDDDGWAVAMMLHGEAEPALVGPWTMGRDKKNPRCLKSSPTATNSSRCRKRKRVRVFVVPELLEGAHFVFEVVGGGVVVFEVIIPVGVLVVQPFFFKILQSRPLARVEITDQGPVGPVNIGDRQGTEGENKGGNKPPPSFRPVQDPPP